MQFLQLNDELQYFKAKYEVTKELEQIVTQLGYTLFEPDFFESYDQFVQMNQRVKTQSLVKLLDQDGSILVLRPDITTSVIKRVIPKWVESNTLRLFYLSTIFSRSSVGSVEEKKQFGIEHLGTNQRIADVETIQLIISLFKRFNLSFLIELSNNQFLNALMKELQLSFTSQKELKEILYYKNQAALEMFIKQTTIPSPFIELVSQLLHLQGSLVEIKQILSRYPLTSPMQNAMDELEVLMNSFSIEEQNQSIRIDLTVLSQYDYYDGLIFKAYVPTIPVPILSGGRYDPLTKMVGLEIPAIGFTLNMSDFIKEVIQTNE
ncbi:MAG: ATP phosphoribosyltransferase regulatory subunit [bacterium]|nr:ATP phosphoribosyltransferase regulatory subunit [bacterium]